MARQHPGEVTGSWMVEGAIDYLLEDTFEARFLREQCIFKIFPMINVDGVIHGNNRCSLSGADLNRKWKNPNSKLFPEVYHAYHQIRKMNQERNINLVVDFHGHSKKLNAFFYGNSCIKRPEEPKIFPMVVSKHNRAVKFDQCRFKIQPGFDSTARQALQKMVKIKRIYTLEASQYGYMNLIGNKLEFTPYKYQQLGRNVCHVLFLQTFQDYQRELTLRPPLPNLQNKKKKDQNRDYIGEYHERMRKREAKAQKLQNQFKENVKDPNNLVELKVVTSQLKKQEKLKLQKKKEAEELRLAQIEQGIISDNQKEENLESEDIIYLYRNSIQKRVVQFSTDIIMNVLKNQN
ncbi:hypothetical protein PPERSA_06990 [Pseudocohnilembus persalinus]|uniref:Peptidase M14 domain-containing protein n=1 Tax=Pseudocohnilembus persalinus TaxID=266149 RepID=A0A0V0QYH3_PSEPJ|nr:hypothetical protein PPERSA_06990 [Pseudocohnilembus persalinus]|eukprot:KRX07375.1 hypothetical protein PPERSA_06990 [Pseudocohnilembus persalinus]